MINNQTEAISKTTKIDSEGLNTVTLEGILDLAENQIISITISNPASHYAYVRVYSSSRFFIFSKGTLGHSIAALSTHYNPSSTKMPANTFSKLNSWDISSPQTLNHYSNVQLQQGEFVAPIPGYYQINIALYLSNCTTAAARLSVKTDNSYEAIGPDISLTKESNDCYLENSLLLHLDTNDTLRLEVKSDKKYTVLSNTSYQVIFQTTYTLWPAAIFTLQQPFQFKTNSAPVKVSDWSHHTEGDWNDMFFNASKDEIQIKTPGLYLFSYNLVVKATAGGQFHSEIVVSGNAAGDGGSCQRGNAPQTFTCTTSTLLNLMEEDKVAVQVWMNDGTKAKQSSVQVSTSSRMTVTLLGDTRSHPVFKLNVQPPKTAYSTKANSKDTKTLTDFTFPNTSFFQSGAVFSNVTKTFNSGKDIGFLLLNNLQLNLQNDGYLTSVIGSEANNTMVYSKDHKKSHFSLPASDLTLDSQFYFNVSAEATKTALKWQPESGSVVSGVYVDKTENMTCFKAQLKANTKLQCSSKWTQIPVKHWNLKLLLNDIATVTKTGIQIAKSGFYLTSLNFAVKANTSNTVINVKISSAQHLNLSASETSPADGVFSIFLQAILEATSGQNVDIQVKCQTPTEITYAKGGGLFAFKVDERRTSPGMRKRFTAYHRYRYGHSDRIGSFYPYYSYGNGNFEQFRQDIQNNNWKLTVARSGLYLITVVGYVRTYTYYYVDNTDHFELGFSSPTSMNATGATCSLDSSPLYFKDSDTKNDESLALTGFVSWDKNDIAGFLGRFGYYSVSYSSRFYMSIQFVGDKDTSSGFTATLQKDTSLAKGQNHQLPKQSWTSDKKCGQYTTKDAAQFEKFKVSYTGYYVVAMNLVLNHGDGCDFGFCFTVGGKLIKGGVKGSNVGCFKQHLRSENQTSTSTVSNAELLYLKAGQVLSVQLSTNLELTISKKSSFSVFYLGTAGAMLGFSSLINTAIKRPLPSYRSRYYHYHYYYHYHDNDNDYAQYVVAGWDTTIMGFQNGIKSSVNDTFVCSQDGVYMVMAKLHVKAQIQMNQTCKVKLQLAVDGEVLDFAFKRDVGVSANTLSFTTTLRLEKWQGLTVRLSSKLTTCTSVDIEAGSSFSVVYLGKGEVCGKERHEEDRNGREREERRERWIGGGGRGRKERRWVRKGGWGGRDG
ncbi:uncharacterized protein LOC110051211 [Paramuricea clavata]|uniref:Uncharacterized protein LOC110051211 n=1 Tax=Paramuricea clavata TaxID=317549 RepID=A0A6S7LRI3_PARCT|nr:uncharacterized protein LOC110051211 [Paramuricea clavata]